MVGPQRREGCECCCSRLSRREADRDCSWSPDGGGVAPDRGAGERWAALQDVTQGSSGFEPGQGCAETVVGSVTEGQRRRSTSAGTEVIRVVVAHLLVHPHGY